MGDYLSFNLVWALLCLSGLIAAWVLNATGLPGNWIMLAIAAVYCWLMPADSPYAFGWLVVLAMALLAGVGLALTSGGRHPHLGRAMTADRVGLGMATSSVAVSTRRSRSTAARSCSLMSCMEKVHPLGAMRDD